MHKYFTLLLVTLLLSFSNTAFSQNKNAIIEQIKKEFAHINTDTGLKKVLLVEDEFKTGTDRGGELTGYLKNKQIVKIRAWIGISNGFYITEYFLKNNELIFVYKIFNTYMYDEKQNKFDESIVDRKFEGRYYFNNKKLIDKIAIGDAQTNTDEASLLKEANEYMSLLNKKHK